MENNEKCEMLINDILRPEKVLHSLRQHPDYEYETTTAARKCLDGEPPEGDGWEINADHRDGFERFEYHEEEYWRRRKAEGVEE